MILLLYAVLLSIEVSRTFNKSDLQGLLWLAKNIAIAYRSIFMAFFATVTTKAPYGPYLLFRSWKLDSFEESVSIPATRKSRGITGPYRPSRCKWCTSVLDNLHPFAFTLAVTSNPFISIPLVHLVTSVFASLSPFDEGIG
jgi:hypothetical protein